MTKLSAWEAAKKAEEAKETEEAKEDEEAKEAKVCNSTSNTQSNRSSSSTMETEKKITVFLSYSFCSRTNILMEVFRSRTSDES